MKTVSIFELRDNLADYLNAVSKSRTPLVINRYDKPLAIIMPYKDKDLYTEIDDLFGFLGTNGEDGTSFVNRVRRSKKERAYVRKLRSQK